MLFIKIKVKGYLQNITKNTQDLIETQSIKKSNTINYINNFIKHQIIIDKDKITLIRENDQFKSGIIFKENITTKSEYYLKELNSSLEFSILTTNLIIKENKIDIIYKILESDNIYHYVLEMSDLK